MSKGWAFAFLGVVVMSMFNAYLKFASQFDVHPAIFVCQSMFIGSFMLLVLGGPGRLAVETVKIPATWGYGLAFLTSTALFFAITRFISATDTTLAVRITAVISPIIAYVYFNRRTGVKGWIGALTILLGVSTVYVFLETNHKALVLLLIFSFGLLQSAQFFLAETHKTNIKANDHTSNLRVTGLVMAMTSFVMMFVLLIASGLSSLLGYGDLGGVLPKFYHYISLPSLALALVYGAFGISVIRYSEFVATKHIKTENFIALIAASPLITLGSEVVMAYFGLVEMPSIGPSNIVGGGMIVLGSLMMILLGNNDIPILEEDFGEEEKKEQLKMFDEVLETASQEALQREEQRHNEWMQKNNMIKEES